MRTRTRTSLALAMALGLIASFSLASVAFAAETTLTATLAGDAETDEDGSGSATVVLDPDAGTACWDMSAEGIDPVTISHIHVGAAGESGDVVVDLDLDGFEGTSEGCNEAADADALQAIIDNPAGYYVNLHNEAFPGGAIRGQLAATNPNTALPTTDRTAVIVGMFVLALATAIALRTWRPFATRN
ncbi:MAG TPA: CHRD domain-containing protein [Candidatus Limnocylindria bacterium]|nr:CHRD domain-containing protein [Candidatus Limnocylindria bacterium]